MTAVATLHVRKPRFSCRLTLPAMILKLPEDRCMGVSNAQCSDTLRPDRRASNSRGFYSSNPNRSSNSSRVKTSGSSQGGRRLTS